jgi:hypothetical protein
MLGDVAAAFAASEAELESLGLPAKTTGYAIDLGAGLGLHAGPLAARGYSVIAVDAPHTNNPGDLGSFLAHIDLQADVIERQPVRRPRHRACFR